MKKILLFVILLGLTACGSDDRPSDSSNSGVKGDDAQTACKDACVDSSSMIVEFNESEIPKSSDQRVYNVSLCKGDEKKECVKLDEVICKDNACLSELGLVGTFNENKVVSFAYSGLYSMDYKTVRKDPKE